MVIDANALSVAPKATGRAISLLLELEQRGKAHLAQQLFEAMVEECPDDTKLEDALSEVATKRLDRLPFAQRWLAEKMAAAREEAAKEAAKARLDVRRGDLVTYFAARGDALTAQTLAEIEAVTEESVIQSWLIRAYRGETAGQIFGS
ncbi:MAG TPA: hypothetical protein VMU95_00285 [Trebonia sp.]|nr:hypothetical protein [Trebonia sp.]